MRLEHNHWQAKCLQSCRTIAMETTSCCLSVLPIVVLSALFLVQVVFLLAWLANHVLSMKDEIHRARLVIG